jgi:putative hydroxymethylpyrimidine transport system substrate-binding protein
MKISLAIEWFLNPDHLPFIIAKEMGIFEKYGIDFKLIEPNEHYDGLNELKNGAIEFATNEPLHLIEQFDEKFLSLGSFFETKGGVLLKTSSYDKLKNKESITVTTPVSNETTNSIGFEIIRRFYAKEGVDVKPEQVVFIPNGFEHIKYMSEGADAGWLYFYNFEGIEAQHAKMDVLYLDAKNVGFANFSALDLFVNREFYLSNREKCEEFVCAIKEAIGFIQNYPKEAIDEYYRFSLTDRSTLIDDILSATIECFKIDFRSDHTIELEILHFFREIGITTLKDEKFKTAFLA